MTTNCRLRTFFSSYRYSDNPELRYSFMESSEKERGRGGERKRAKANLMGCEVVKSSLSGLAEAVGSHGRVTRSFCVYMTKSLLA